MARGQCPPHTSACMSSSINPQLHKAYIEGCLDMAQPCMCPKGYHNTCTNLLLWLLKVTHKTYMALRYLCTYIQLSCPLMLALLSLWQISRC